MNCVIIMWGGSIIRVVATETEAANFVDQSNETMVLHKIVAGQESASCILQPHAPIMWNPSGISRRFRDNGTQIWTWARWSALTTHKPTSKSESRRMRKCFTHLLARALRSRNST